MAPGDPPCVYATIQRSASCTSCTVVTSAHNVSVVCSASDFTGEGAGVDVINGPRRSTVCVRHHPEVRFVHELHRRNVGVQRQLNLRSTLSLSRCVRHEKAD